MFFELSVTTGLLATGFTVLLLWLYLKWQSVKTYWAKRGVPYIPPHPILGSLTFLQKINQCIWLLDIHKKYDTPYLGLWKLWKPTLLVSTPELVRRILVKDSKNFRNRHASSGTSDPLGSLNLFTANDPFWSNMRRRLTAMFTTAKLKNQEGLVHTKIKQLCQRIKLERNDRTDIREILTDYTTDIIGISAFGVESNATVTGEGPLRAISKEITKYTIYRGLSVGCIFFFPEVAEIFRFKFFPKLTNVYFRKAFKAIATEREVNDKYKEKKDLVDALINIQKESEKEGEVFTDDMIIAQAAVMLQAGFETSAVMMTYIVYELAFSPNVQEKLYAELVEAERKNGSDVFDTSVLGKLTYLDCVIKEGLRKYPTLGSLDRIAESDYEIDDKLTINAGTPILINVIGIHYDPKYYPNPQKFDPDRFLPENEQNLVPHTFLPFGTGPRNCIGQRFAQMIMTQTITALVLKFKIEPYPDTPKPSEANVQRRSIVYAPEDHIYLNFVPRE